MVEGLHAFRLRFQREWAAKAMPCHIKMGHITVLKTASAISRIAGFPVLDVAGFIGDQLDDFFEGITDDDEAVAGLLRRHLCRRGGRSRGDGVP